MFDFRKVGCLWEDLVSKEGKELKPITLTLKNHSSDRIYALLRMNYPARRLLQFYHYYEDFEIVMDSFEQLDENRARTLLKRIEIACQTGCRNAGAFSTQLWYLHFAEFLQSLSDFKYAQPTHLRYFHQHDDDEHDLPLGSRIEGNRRVRLGDSREGYDAAGADQDI